MGDETFNTAGDKYVDIITVNTVKKKTDPPLPAAYECQVRSGQADRDRSMGHTCGKEKR